jgi:hypothetical protein
LDDSFQNEINDVFEARGGGTPLINNPTNKVEPIPNLDITHLTIEKNTPDMPISKPLKTVCSRIGKLMRENSGLDNKCFFDNETPKTRLASENMTEYMDNYGVSF